MRDCWLRAASLDDLDLLVKHRRLMWEDIGDAYTAEDLDEADPTYWRWLDEQLRRGELHAVVAEAPDGTPVASGCVWLQPIQPRPRAPTRQPYVLSMYTAPERRRQGLARRVVDALVDWSRAQGYATVVLHAAPAGRAVYAAAGFERTWEMRWRPAAAALTSVPVGTAVQPEPPEAAGHPKP